MCVLVICVCFSVKRVVVLVLCVGVSVIIVGVLAICCLFVKSLSTCIIYL